MSIAISLVNFLSMELAEETHGFVVDRIDMIPLLNRSLTLTQIKHKHSCPLQQKHVSAFPIYSLRQDRDVVTRCSHG